MVLQGSCPSPIKGTRTNWEVYVAFWYRIKPNGFKVVGSNSAKTLGGM